MHPEYSTITKYNDIALIELATPVTFDKNIKPICLQTEVEDTEMTRNLTVIGFGIKDLNTSDY